MIYNAPWLTQGYFISFFHWMLEKPLSFLYFSSFPVWVQVHGLPLDYYNMKMASFLAEHLGQFLRFDKESMFRNRGLRFQILISKFSLRALQFLSSKIA